MTIGWVLFFILFCGRYFSVVVLLLLLLLVVGMMGCDKKNDTADIEDSPIK